MSAEEEEARKIAEMGKPILGEHSRLEVVIEESYEFKVHHSCICFPLEEQHPLCVLCCEKMPVYSNSSLCFCCSDVLKINVWMAY